MSSISIRIEDILKGLFEVSVCTRGESNYCIATPLPKDEMKFVTTFFGNPYSEGVELGKVPTHIKIYQVPGNMDADPKEIFLVYVFFRAHHKEDDTTGGKHWVGKPFFTEFCKLSNLREFVERAIKTGIGDFSSID